MGGIWLFPDRSAIDGSLRKMSVIPNRDQFVWIRKTLKLLCPLYPSRTHRETIFPTLWMPIVLAVHFCFCLPNLFGIGVVNKLEITALWLRGHLLNTPPLDDIHTITDQAVAFLRRKEGDECRACIIHHSEGHQIFALNTKPSGGVSNRQSTTSCKGGVGWGPHSRFVLDWRWRREWGNSYGPNEAGYNIPPRIRVGGSDSEPIPVLFFSGVCTERNMQWRSCRYQFFSRPPTHRQIGLLWVGSGAVVVFKCHP